MISIFPSPEPLWFKSDPTFRTLKWFAWVCWTFWGDLGNVSLVTTSLKQNFIVKTLSTLVWHWVQILKLKDLSLLTLPAHLLRAGTMRIPPKRLRLAVQWWKWMASRSLQQWSRSFEILVKLDLSPKQLALFRASRNTYRRQILLEQNHSMSDAHCDEVCSICQDEMDIADTALLPCGHCFHRVCVKEWLISRSLRCPLCNDEIGKRPKSLLVWWATWR